MSKIRIVGGKYTKITGGTHEIYGKRIDYLAKLKVRNDGVQGGVHNTNTPKSPPPPPDALQVIKVEGPFDEKGNLVEYIDKGEFYYYRATTNREPLPHEVLLIKWDREYDDNGGFKRVYTGGTLLDNGKIRFKFRVGTGTIAKKLTIYAYFEKRGNNAKVDARTIITCDAIMVVGSELHEPTYGNKMRFFAQAVRTLLLNKSKWKKVSVIYFGKGYNTQEVNEVKKSLKSKFSDTEIDYISVNTVNELINKINEYENISELHFYSHGMPSKITFGLGHIAENIDGKQTFSFSEVVKLNKNNFLKNAKVYSYACRTGNAQKDVMQNDFTPYYTVQYFAAKADFTEKFINKQNAQNRYNSLKRLYTNVYLYDPSTSPNDALPQNSLAQKLANHLGISVFAYITRSDYQPTWHSNFEKIEIPDKTIEKGWYGVKFWHDGDNALWNKSGAINGVKGGTTPIGLDNSLKEFKPKN